MNYKMVLYKNFKSVNYENVVYLFEVLFDIEENDVFKLCVNKFYCFYQYCDIDYVNFVVYFVWGGGSSVCVCVCLENQK